MDSTPHKTPVMDDDLPAKTEAETEIAEQPTRPPRLEPTRYGDWELNGKCVDF